MGRHSAGEPLPPQPTQDVAPDPAPDPVPEPRPTRRQVAGAAGSALLGIPDPPEPLPGRVADQLLDHLPTVTVPPATRAPLPWDEPGEATPERHQHGWGRRLTLAVVVLVLVGLAAALLLSHGSRARPRPAAGPAVRSQHTLLLTIDAPGSNDLGVLLAADAPRSTASMTLLPSRLLAAVPGRGTQSLGSAFAQRDSESARGTVADLLGVTVDGTWRLQDGAFERLVDQQGGVGVDVDSDVVADGKVLLRAGAGQHLNGASALAFASFLAPEEDEAVRLGRLRAVLSAVFAALPVDPVQRGSQLGSLGAGSVVSLDGLDLPGFLTSYLGAPRRDDAILPVVTIDTGGGSTAYRVEAAAVKAYVSSVLADSVPAGTAGPSVRVFVYNGVGTANLGALVRPKLVAAGLTLAGSQNEATFDRRETLVLVKDSSADARAAGLRVAKALQLPPERLRVGNDSTRVADVVVLAGADLQL